jgi:DNA-directed RNA polymerase specialized sigma24 family protein
VTTATSELEFLLRRLAPQVLGAVVRRYGDFDAAEDATQEALLAAAVQWPQDGVPDYPLGRLITVASRRLTDLLRANRPVPVEKGPWRAGSCRPTGTRQPLMHHQPRTTPSYCSSSAATRRSRRQRRSP